MKYIPRHEKYTELALGTKKASRGFSNLTTGRLLCPRPMRDCFDENPEAFCQDVRSGARKIYHDDWPSFLYPEEGYKPEAIDHTMLQGPFLLACFRHIFTGPRTALNMSPGTLPGKKSIAKLHNITEVSPENIAYTAVMCRHIINTNESWTNMDGVFHAQRFYHNIVKLFNDKKWADETLSWWNEWVFGDDCVNDNAYEKNQDSGVAKLTEQRLARRTQASTHNVSSTRSEE